MGNNKSIPNNNKHNEEGFNATYKALIEGLQERSLEMSEEDFEMFIELFRKLSDEDINNNN